MNKPLNKSEIATALAMQTGQTKRAAVRFLDALVELVYQEGKTGFVLPGLCKFAVTRRKQGRRYNVATRRHYLVAAHDVLRVIPLKRARMRIAPPPPNLIIGELPSAPSERAKEEPAGMAPAPAAALSPSAPPAPETPVSDSGSVVFDCPNCGASIMAQSHERGQPGACPQCGGEIVVPAAAPPAAEGTPPSTVSPGQFITFICDACDQEIEAPLDMVGMKAECPACGSPLKVPKKDAHREKPASPQGSPEEEEKGDRRSMTIRMDLSDFLS